eukprot:m.339099 g.339099  ORF g.339099 m.339099 type:complete len:128 (+) comp19815_c0_seq5:437-820(+)
MRSTLALRGQRPARWTVLRSTTAVLFLAPVSVCACLPCSQPHKHLQVVPAQAGLPVDLLVVKHGAGQQPFRFPEFPFQHACVKLEPNAADNEAWSLKLHRYATLVAVAVVIVARPPCLAKHLAVGSV